MSMGATQAWARGGICPPPPRNVTKCFCALVFTAKRRQIIYASFSQRIVCFWLQSPQIPGLHPRIALGDFRLQTPNCPPGKNPVGANERVNYKSNSNNLNAWLTAAQWQLFLQFIQNYDKQTVQTTVITIISATGAVQRGGAGGRPPVKILPPPPCPAQ